MFFFAYSVYKSNHTTLRAKSDTWECKRGYKIQNIHNELNEMSSTLHCWTDLSFKSKNQTCTTSEAHLKLISKNSFIFRQKSTSCQPLPS